MNVDVALSLLGALVLGVGLFSTSIKRLWLSAPLVATVAGIALGPEVLGVVRPGRILEYRSVVEEVARLTLAFSLMASALQFTKDDLRFNRMRGALLLTVGMAGMWAVTSAGAWLLLDVPFWVAALVGAILMPTDPVVASTLVSGRLAEKSLPRWLRRTLQLESGANDGLAVAFVLLPAIVLSEPHGAIGMFAGEVVRELGLALSLGAGFGFLAAVLVNRLQAEEAMERSFFLASSMPLAVMTLGTVHWLGGSGVLASFIAGLAFSLRLEKQHAEELEKVQSAMERFLLVPMFVLFGTMLPWSAWTKLGWAGLAFAGWALLARRPPVVPIALAPTNTDRGAVAFLAWFGPIGVAAIYYSLFVERFALEHYHLIFAAATLAISASIVVHSLTATFGAQRFARRSQRMAQDGSPVSNQSIDTR